MRFYETLDVGDEFFEEDYGYRGRFRVTKPTSVQIMESEGRRQFVWKAVEITGEKNDIGVEVLGEEIDYLITEGYEHYGPKVYPANS